MAARYFFDCSFAQGTTHCLYQQTNQIAFVQIKQLNQFSNLVTKNIDTVGVIIGIYFLIFPSCHFSQHLNNKYV